MKSGIQVTWLKEKNIKCVEGDLAFNHSSSSKVKLSAPQAAAINDGKRVIMHMHVIAFVDRENTGTQPVPDWVPVETVYDAHSEPGLARDFTWESAESKYSIITWKPSMEALFLIYEAEQRDQNDVRTTVRKVEIHEALVFRAELIEFIAANKLGRPGETCADTVKRELAEKHNIDMRTAEQRTRDALSDRINGYVARGCIEDISLYIDELLSEFTITLNGD